eukprot:365126-Chlamydomonas_euryale.AAC.56
MSLRWTPAATCGRWTVAAGASPKLRHTRCRPTRARQWSSSAAQGAWCHAQVVPADALRSAPGSTAIMQAEGTSAAF